MFFTKKGVKAGYSRMKTKTELNKKELESEITLTKSLLADYEKKVKNLFALESVLKDSYCNDVLKAGLKLEIDNTVDDITRWEDDLSLLMTQYEKKNRRKTKAL
jgi:hypothetical protein